MTTTLSIPLGPGLCPECGYTNTRATLEETEQGWVHPCLDLNCPGYRIPEKRLLKWYQDRQALEDRLAQGSPQSSELGELLMQGIRSGQVILRVDNYQANPTTTLEYLLEILRSQVALEEGSSEDSDPAERNLAESEPDAYFEDEDAVRYWDE